MHLSLGRFYVPLCRMIPLPKVRPIQEVGVATLEKRFERYYIDGDRVMYIFIFYDHLLSMNVTEERIASWAFISMISMNALKINFSQTLTMLYSEGRHFLCGMEITGSQLDGVILMLNMSMIFYDIIPYFALFSTLKDALHCY